MITRSTTVKNSGPYMRESGEHRGLVRTTSLCRQANRQGMGRELGTCDRGCRSSNRCSIRLASFRLSFCWPSNVPRLLNVSQHRPSAANSRAEKSSISNNEKRTDYGAMSLCIS